MIRKYEDAYDIYQFFKTKEEVGNMLRFVVDRALTFSKIIKENGDKKPGPISWLGKVWMHQIDYQFFIYSIAEYIAKVTQDESALVRVFRDYGILEATSKNVKSKKNKRLFMIFLEDTLVITATNQLAKEKGGKGKPPWKFSYITDGIPVVQEKNGEYFEKKVVSLHRFGLVHFVPEWEELMASHAEYFMQEELEQVAFQFLACEKFWAENGMEKRIYFTTRMDTMNDVHSANCKI